MKKVVFIKAWKEGRVPIGTVAEMEDWKAKEEIEAGNVELYDGPVKEGQNVNKFAVTPEKPKKKLTKPNK